MTVCTFAGHREVFLSSVYRDFGGAFDTVNYVLRQGKRVLNLAKMD